ncbi:MAG: KH domain-containing protein [Candidatus Bathyarchaeia archaeon]
MSGSILRTKIPIERVGVLIGPGGSVKRTVEEKLSVQLQVDSKTGDIEVTTAPGVNPANAFRARDIVVAIGRGFSPENALRLLDEELSLIIIDLRDFFGRSRSDIMRVKGRIIGTNGKARRNLEEYTNTKISVYGHTVSIIGDVEHIEVAREAINLLIHGGTHQSVYRFLDEKKAELRKSEAEIWRSSIGDKK